MGLVLEAQVRERLLDYLDVLARWNRTYNLTAIRDPLAMVEGHLLDSLSVLAWVRSGRLLDVGSGAGLPGLVLAMVRPDVHAVLLDGAGKRVRFLTHAITALGVGNAEAVQARVERYRPDALFDSVVSRATMDLATLIESAGPLVGPGGCLLAMKGRHPDEELARVGAAAPGLRVERLRVPGREARHLVIFEPGRASGPDSPHRRSAP
jgi:16S rRNA (guanine527-N7)-methyltransferase